MWVFSWDGVRYFPGSMFRQPFSFLYVLSDSCGGFLVRHQARYRWLVEFKKGLLHSPSQLGEAVGERLSGCVDCIKQTSFHTYTERAHHANSPPATTTVGLNISLRKIGTGSIGEREELLKIQRFVHQHRSTVIICHS